MKPPKDNRTYRVERHKEFHSGMYRMDMSVGPPKLVRLHGPRETHTMPFECETTNTMPDIPAPSLPGVTFMHGELCVAIPQNMGTFASYLVQGAYVFESLEPGHMAGPMEVGACPSDGRFIRKAEVRPSNFVEMTTGRSFTIGIGQG